MEQADLKYAIPFGMTVSMVKAFPGAQVLKNFTSGALLYQTPGLKIMLTPNKDSYDFRKRINMYCNQSQLMTQEGLVPQEEDQEVT